MSGMGVLLAAAAALSAAICVVVREKPEKPVEFVIASLLLTMAGALGIGLVSSACNMVSLPDAIAWFRGRPNECSLVGGCLGFALAMRLFHADFDRFAPAGALVLCAVRLAEGFLPPAGLGPELEEAIPLLSSGDGYGGYNVALFLLEALPAALCCAVLLWRHCPDGGFRKTAALLCAAQVVFENMRISTLMIGFVRTEQVLCGLVLLGMALCGPKKGRGARSAGVLLLAAVCGLLQFVTDKPYLLLDRLPLSDEAYESCFAAVVPVCWALTALCAIGMLLIIVKERRTESK